MSKTRHSEPYLQGFAAWHNAIALDHCPYVYRAETQRAMMDWTAGWLDAQRHAATLGEAELAGLELPVA